jgi:hypothetical protein
MNMTVDPDEQLLDHLRKLVVQRDAPPAHVRDAAKAALTWRTIDEELAELCYDSLAQAPAAAGVRDDGDSTRTLSFETNGRGVEIEVIEQGDRRRIVGQLLPPGPGRVEIRSGRPEEVVEAEADHLGRFQADDLPRGPIRLRCQPDDRAAISTTWINI